MLKINNLSKSFGSTRVLNEISFDADEGDILAVLGRNGTGKTTILRLLADLVTEDSGSMALNGDKIKRGDTSLITNNDRSFFWRLSTYENLRYFLGMSGLDNKFLDSSIQSLAKEFGVQNKLHSTFSSLSAGEKKKISLIRMLLKDQKIMLFDEVTTNLDLETKDTLIMHLKKLAEKEKKIMLWVTHNFDELNNFSNRYILLSNSKIKKEGHFTNYNEELQYLSKELGNA
jgi:ABC-type multidrug transport system ATPase subunit